MSMDALTAWDQADLLRQFNNLDLSDQVEDCIQRFNLDYSDYQQAREQVMYEMRNRLERSIGIERSIA